MPCWLREQILRKFDSKDFMSEERKEVENEKIQLFSQPGKSNIFKKKWKGNNANIEMNQMSARDNSGSRERIAVDSIQRKNNSSLQISVTKNLAFISPCQIYPNCTYSSTKHKNY